MSCEPRRLSQGKSVAEAIREADALLPGVPVDGGQDPRWQAIIAVGEYLESEPDAVWKFIRRWGGHPQEDVRDAIATCLLEHLIDCHFDQYFPKVEKLALEDRSFAETFLRSWPSAEEGGYGSSERVAALRKRLREP